MIRLANGPTRDCHVQSGMFACVLIKRTLSFCTNIILDLYFIPNVIQGQGVWIPHAKEGWIGGEIQSIEEGGKNLVVQPEDGGEVSVQSIRLL